KVLNQGDVDEVRGIKKGCNPKSHQGRGDRVPPESGALARGPGRGDRSGGKSCRGRRVRGGGRRGCNVWTLFVDRPWPVRTRATFAEQDDAQDQQDDAPADRGTEHIDLTQQECSTHDQKGGAQPGRRLEAVEQVAP